MAGMGTGLAPWRAVTQERICQHRQGQKVGPCHLFFGARYNAAAWLNRFCQVVVLEKCSFVFSVFGTVLIDTPKWDLMMSTTQDLRRSCACYQEYLYRDEFEGYEKEGVLSMHTAFSREQAVWQM